MTRPPHNAVVVGFDGSTGSTQALDWGAREADRRGLRLHVVHVWQPPPMLSAGFGTPTMPDSEAILVDAAMRVGNVAPQLTVSTQAVPAPVAGAFIEASFDAATIVIGAHGYRRVGIRDYGSTAWQVAIHAYCPVVVVREIADDERRSSIVVGVDGSAESALALDYAFERAAFFDVHLVAVHGWQLERLDEFTAAVGGAADRDRLEEARAAELTDCLRPLVARYPCVNVRRVSAREQAATAIIRESRSAQLVVVGSRGRGGFRGMLLGSVGMELLRRATCPVAIVRP